MKKTLLYLLLITIILSIAGCKTKTISAEKGNPTTQTTILYSNGATSEKIEVPTDQVKNYTKDYKWSTQPATLMYAADGRTYYMWNSEVEAYKKVGWSTYPPITLYGYNNQTLTCLVEHKQLYLNTKKWFETKEQVPKPVFTYNVFTKSNLTVEQISKILSGTKIQTYAQDFYDMEQKHNVNALFCLSVACLESGGGAKNANKNNFFGFRTKRGWMSFSTPRDGIFYFGELMNKKMYFGKSIEQIGLIYCDGSWSPKVKQIMNNRWNRL